MATVDERSRHGLYLSIEALIGAEKADTLMSMLPPVGWADVATKHDLAMLTERMDLRFEAFEARIIGDVHKALRDQLRMLMFATFTIVSLNFTAIALLR